MTNIKHNHMFDVAFAIETEISDPYAVPVSDLIAAVKRRVEYLEQNPDDAVDAFGYCDSYQVKGE